MTLVVNLLSSFSEVCCSWCNLWWDCYVTHTPRRNIELA